MRMNYVIIFVTVFMYVSDAGCFFLDFIKIILKL